MLAVHPIPAFRMPEAMILISAVVDELDELRVGNEAVGDGKVVEIDLVKRELVVEAEPIGVIADVVKTLFNVDKLAAR